MLEKFMLPFYLNEELINQMYSIVLQRFTKTRNTSKKKQCTINLTAPLNNFIEGEYVDGNISIQILNEYNKLNIDEKNYTLIQNLFFIINTLKEKNILKIINNLNDLNDLKKNDFFIVNTSVKNTCVFETLKKMVDFLEMNIYFEKNKDDNLIKLFDFTKLKLNNLEKNDFIKYMSKEMYKTNTKFILTINKKYLIYDINQLKNSDMFIFAKVLNFYDDTNNKKILLDFDNSLNYLNKFSEYNKHLNNTQLLIKNVNEDIKNFNLFDCLPIGIYI